MKRFSATIQADRYPMTFQVEASDWPTAAARAMRQWKKRFKRSRATTIKIRLDLLGEAYEDSSDLR